MNAVDAATLDIGAGWGDVASVKLTSPDGASEACVCPGVLGFLWHPQGRHKIPPH